MSIWQTISSEAFIFLFRKTWQQAAGHRRLMVLSIALAVIAHILVLLEPLIFAAILNEIQVNGLSADNLWYITFLILLFSILELVFWCFWHPSRVTEQKAAFLTEAAYREHLMRGVLGLNLTWHNDHDSGETLDKINQAGQAIRTFSSNLYEPIRIIIRIPGTFLVLFFFGWKIALTMLVLLMLTFVVIFYFDRLLSGKYVELNELQNRVGARTFDIISNVQSIKILHGEKQSFKNFKAVIRAPFKKTVSTDSLQESKWFVGMNLFRLMVVVCLLIYVWSLYQSGMAIELGTLSALYLYLTSLMELFIVFSYYYGELIIFKTRIQNADSIETAITKHKAKRLQSLTVKKELVLDDLHFSYNTGDGELVLKNINLSIPVGQKIACIGHSGSGKTTFLKILHGLYEEAKTTVTIDGKTIKKQLHEIYLGTTLVPQEPELFSASIRENITFGIDTPQKNIDHVAKLAAFADVADKLEKKYDSKINERGVNLSGGQKQRLALARALLFAQDKDIILLDESTSSVDPEAEATIYRNIFSEFGGKTFLASIHKLNLLKYFERILIFDNGIIIADGTFEELLDSNDHFKKMWEDFVTEQNDS